MENSSFGNIQNQKLTFDVATDPINELKQKQYEEKIMNLEPEVARKLFQNFQNERELPEEKMFKFMKKPYKEMVKQDKESVLLYLGFKGAPQEFDPQDVYEIYSLKNYRYMLPLTTYLSVIIFLFSSHTHVLNKSKLMGLTYEYCFRSRALGFIGIPFATLSLSKMIVKSSTQEEYDSFFNKYDLDNELFEQRYNSLVFGDEKEE